MGFTAFRNADACTTQPKLDDQHANIVLAMLLDPSKMLPACSAPDTHGSHRSEVLHVPSLPPHRCSRWFDWPSRRRKRRRSLRLIFVHPSLDLEVFLHSRVYCHRPPFPTTSSAVLPWAFATPLSPYLSARPPEDVVAESVAASEETDDCWAITSKNCTKVRSPR
jgi:hypothetical protein